MKILVCMSCVPDTTSRIAFTQDNTTFDASGVNYVIGPYEDFALARAVELKEAGKVSHITVINVGEADTEPVIRKALAIGADEAVRVNAAPADGWFVAQQIAAYAKENSFDIIMTGRESIDYNNGQVHGLLSVLLNTPSVSPVIGLEVDGNTSTLAIEIEGGTRHATAELPLILGCQEPIAEWRIPNMRGIMMARKKPLKVIEPVSQEAKTSVLSYELPPARQACQFIEADQAGSLIDILRNEKRVI